MKSDEERERTNSTLIRDSSLLLLLVTGTVCLFVPRVYTYARSSQTNERGAGLLVSSLSLSFHV